MTGGGGGGGVKYVPPPLSFDSGKMKISFSSGIAECDFLQFSGITQCLFSNNALPKPGVSV